MELPDLATAEPFATLKIEGAASTGARPSASTSKFPGGGVARDGGPTSTGARPSASTSEFAGSGDAGDGGPTSTGARPSASTSEFAGSGDARDGGPTSTGALVVADGGGTFAQARIPVSVALVECFDVPNFVIARLSREPVVKWEPFGELVSDGGNAAFFSEEGLAEARAIEDEMWLWDKVDDADLPAAIALPSGAIAAYFSVGGDGSFAMSLGRDAQGAPAVFVVEVPELHLED